MLTEIRKLIFPKDVLQEALLHECKSAGIEVPNSQIQDIKMTGETPVRVVLQFVTAHVKRPLEVPLSEHFVLTAMIVTCRKYGVPLARYSKKSIELHEQGLVMVMRMEIKTKK